MQHPTLRERHRPPHKLTQPLPQRVIPPLHMIRQSRILPDRLMLIARNHHLVRLPQIRVALRSLVPPRDFPPQRPARHRAAIPGHQRHHLPGHGTQRNPDPARVGFREHERPEFIELERPLVWWWWAEGGVQRGEGVCFFLIQSLMVWRSTPKVRCKPRRLERSWLALMMMSFSASV